MKLSLKYDLPFVAIQISYKGKTTEISNILVDTGSGSTILSADIVSDVGIVPEPDDILYHIRGVGGSEVVFSRRVDLIRMDESQTPDFEIEVGGMDYGFEINGILGMDFLLRAGAIIDLKELTLRSWPSLRGRTRPKQSPARRTDCFVGKYPPRNDGDAVEKMLCVR